MEISLEKKVKSFSDNILLVYILVFKRVKILLVDKEFQHVSVWECINVRVVCIFLGFLGDDFLVFVCVESGASVLDSENILETRLYTYNMNGLINVDLTPRQGC